MEANTRVPRLVADDWSKSSGRSLAPGRGHRLGVNLGVLMGGTLALMGRYAKA